MTVSKPEFNILTDPVKRAAAEYMLFKCGVRSKYKGFVYLADAALIYYDGTEDGFGLIYDAVARFRGKTTKAVCRDMSYAVENSPDLGERLAAMSGTDCDFLTIKPSAVVSIVGRHLSYENGRDCDR